MRKKRKKKKNTKPTKKTPNQLNNQPKTHQSQSPHLSSRNV